jgi:hypothetical protein
VRISVRSAKAQKYINMEHAPFGYEQKTGGSIRNLCKHIYVIIAVISGGIINRELFYARNNYLFKMRGEDKGKRLCRPDG